MTNNTKNPLFMGETQLSQVRALLANLCYVEPTPEMDEFVLGNPSKNRLAEMGEYRLKSKLLRLGGAESEARVLEAIEALVSQGLAPTFNAVEEMVAAATESATLAHEAMQKIRGHRTIERDVTGLAFAIGMWAKERYMAHEMYRLAEEVVMGPYGTFSDKFQQVMDALSELAPITRKSRTKTYDRLWKDVQEFAREAVRRRELGLSTGPEFPWPDLNKLVRGGISKDEMWLITGATKSGKTTFASEIGRHIAFEQQDYLVLMLHLETSPLTLAQREVCWTFNVQPGDIRQGLVDPDAEPWKTYFRKAEAKIAMKCGVGEESRFIYEHCPGLTYEELEYFVRVYKARAEALGLELVVILDYYQEMDWSTIPNVNNETQGLNILATKLKTLFEDYEVYSIIFAQEADDDSDRRGRTTPYMAKKIVKRAQGHIRILRGETDEHAVAKFDQPVESYQNGQVMRDDLVLRS